MSYEYFINEHMLISSRSSKTGKKRKHSLRRALGRLGQILMVEFLFGGK